MTRKIALCIVLLLTAAIGTAQNNGTIQRKENCAALIWGVSDYNRHEDGLRTPVNDAQVLAERLKQLGFKLVRVVENPSLAEQNASLYQFCIEAKTCDVALFFFAGHGVVAENDYDMMENYLLPRDWVHYSVPGSCLPLNRVAKALDNIENCKVKLMFIDACRARINDDNLFSQRLPKLYDNIWYLFSTADGEKAVDGTGHSPFMQAMLQQLEVPNLKIDQFLAGLRDRLDSLQPPKFNISGKGDFVFYPDESAQTDQQLFIIEGTTLQYCNKSAKGLIMIPNTVTAIGKRAFKDCKQLTSVIIPNTVSSIGDYAFEDCESLTNVTIPHSVTSIGINTFSGCETLNDIIIPPSVKSIEYGAFAGIKNILYYGSASGAPWGALAINGYWDGYLLYADKAKTKLEACASAATTIRIPSTVTAIDDYAFAWCKNLTSISIPNSVKSIGKNAFLYCTSLTDISLPNSVKAINNETFWGCESLTHIDISNSVESIGNEAFWGCKALTNVSLPNSLKSIGDGAFWGCESLPTIIIPRSVKSIGNNTFAWCASLSDVTFSNTIETIGDEAFAWCKSLINITVPNTVKSIGEKAFRFVLNVNYSGTATGEPWGAMAINGYWDGDLLYADNSKTKIEGCSHTATSVTIPSTVTVICDEAFRFCESLVSVNMPNSMEFIGDNAFCRCTSLKVIVIPNSVTTIGTAAFWGCDSLSSVIISNAVMHIGKEAFGACKSLVNITIPNSIVSIGEDVFEECEALEKIYVAKESKGRIKQLLPAKFHAIITEE